MRSADDRTLVIVASDHGFTSFRRGVGLNAWLHRHGYLALRDGVAPGPGAGEFFAEVDWGRTKAYALGFGGIYLNIKGREASGIVDPGVAEALAGELAERIAGLIDPERGATAVLGARTRASLYSGPFANESPDLVVEFARGYRASWTTALGGIPDSLFEDNTRKWAGDHIVAPELVPGVLFMNRAFAGNGARLVDLAPTILGFHGIPVPGEYEGRSLLVSPDE
jgi:predicted AlkP superfamily phosphohydrolase/phosphomutase